MSLLHKCYDMIAPLPKAVPKVHHNLTVSIITHNLPKAIITEKLHLASKMEFFWSLRCDSNTRPDATLPVWANYESVLIRGIKNPPLLRRIGAGDVTRTHDLLITNQLHYRLCYTSDLYIIFYFGFFVKCFFKNNKFFSSPLLQKVPFYAKIC